MIRREREHALEERPRPRRAGPARGRSRPPRGPRGSAAWSRCRRSPRCGTGVVRDVQLGSAALRRRRAAGSSPLEQDRRDVDVLVEIASIGSSRIRPSARRVVSDSSGPPSELSRADGSTSTSISSSSAAAGATERAGAGCAGGADGPSAARGVGVERHATRMRSTASASPSVRAASAARTQQSTALALSPRSASASPSFSSAPRWSGTCATIARSARSPCRSCRSAGRRSPRRAADPDRPRRARRSPGGASSRGFGTGLVISIGFGGSGPSASRASASRRGRLGARARHRRRRPRRRRRCGLGDRLGVERKSSSGTSASSLEHGRVGALERIVRLVGRERFEAAEALHQLARALPRRRAPVELGERR